LLALTPQLASMPRDLNWSPTAYRTLLADYYELIDGDTRERRSVA
jgi:hypothetical protein